MINSFTFWTNTFPVDLIEVIQQQGRDWIESGEVLLWSQEKHYEDQRQTDQSLNEVAVVWTDDVVGAANPIEENQKERDHCFKDDDFGIFGEVHL